MNFQSETNRVIILAAGQGARLKPLTEHRPKSLLPVGGQPLLARTIQQLLQSEFEDITVVVGYQQDLVRQTLAEQGLNVKFVENLRYAEDTNSLSMLLGLNSGQGPALVIEADVALADSCLPIIHDVTKKEQSVWFTCGRFQPDQRGGIIKSDDENRILDIRIVQSYEGRYANYSKNLGVLFIGPHEITYYYQLLDYAVSQTCQQYYMEHWIDHLEKLPCWEKNLFPLPASSFNTMDEYRRCCELMEV
jgi:choline kinase